MSANERKGCSSECAEMCERAGRGARCADFSECAELNERASRGARCADFSECAELNECEGGARCADSSKYAELNERAAKREGRARCADFSECAQLNERASRGARCADFSEYAELNECEGGARCAGSSKCSELNERAGGASRGARCADFSEYAELNERAAKREGGARYADFSKCAQLNERAGGARCADSSKYAELNERAAKREGGARCADFSECAQLNECASRGARCAGSSGCAELNEHASRGARYADFSEYAELNEREGRGARCADFSECAGGCGLGKRRFAQAGDAGELERRLKNHPCFSESAHGRSGRMHIPCAPRCNLSCAFCGGGLDDGEVQLPGRAMALVTAETAEAYVSQRLARHPEISVLGVAGPGEPLFNEETFRVLALLGRRFPEMLLCVGTNGFFLPENAERLARLGVETLTVTINAVSPQVGARLNPFLIGANGARLEGEAAARELLARQKEGVFRAVQLGMTVKINSVCVPGVNDGELRQIAETARELGASRMNVMPLRPAGRLRHAAAPSPDEIHRLRAELEGILPQLRHCYQCRADACGVPGMDEAFGGCAK